MSADTCSKNDKKPFPEDNVPIASVCLTHDYSYRTEITFMGLQCVLPPQVYCFRNVNNFSVTQNSMLLDQFMRSFEIVLQMYFLATYQML